MKRVLRQGLPATDTIGFGPKSRPAIVMSFSPAVGQFFVCKGKKDEKNAKKTKKTQKKNKNKNKNKTREEQEEQEQEEQEEHQPQDHLHRSLTRIQ